MNRIVLCFDNSDPSFVVSEYVVTLARVFGSEVVGVHGYNAFMHQGAFRIMEPTLPQEYQIEEIIRKQRRRTNGDGNFSEQTLHCVLEPDEEMQSSLSALQH
jgi:hypothetical protein